MTISPLLDLFSLGDVLILIKLKNHLGTWNKIILTLGQICSGSKASDHGKWRMCLSSCMGISSCISITQDNSRPWSSVIQGKVEVFHRKPWMQGVWLKKPETPGSCFLWQMLAWWLWQNMVWNGAFLYFSLLLYLSFPNGAFCHLNSLQEGEVDTPHLCALFNVSLPMFGVEAVVILYELM